MNPNLKILIYRGGGLGDFLFIFPLLHLLRLRHPNAVISVCAPDSWRALLAFSPAHEIISIESLELWRLFGGEDGTLGLKRLLENAERILWFGDPGNDLAKRLMILTQRRATIVPPFPSDTFMGTLYDYVACVGGFGLESPEWKKLPWPLIQIPNERCREEKSLLIWHPGSGGMEKRWSLDKAMKAVERVTERRSIQIAAVMGPAESGDILERIEQRLRVEIWNGLKIEDLAVRMAQGNVYFGNDSGISHLAALIGLKGVVMFGPTDPDRWKPFGSLLKVRPFNRPVGEIARLIESRIIDR